VLLPWLALALVGYRYVAIPIQGGERPALAPVVLVLIGPLIALVQFGRSTALGISRGTVPARLESGRALVLRNAWRTFALRVFGLDLPRREIEGLNLVSFRVETGMVGLLGPNGAGKTTLLRLLAGVLEPSLGTIRFGGVRLDAIRRHIAHWVGYLPQEFGLPNHLTAREYLEYFALLYGLAPRADREARVTKLLTEVGLADREHERIGSFSGGMRQRVAVARALLREPPVIIVDEPTVGLDPRERIRFRNLLARLARTRVVLFSTHVVEDVAVSCDRVIVMAQGAIVYDGKPDELAHAAHDRTWELVLTAGSDQTLESTAKIVDRVPLTDDRQRVRILCATPPHREATPIEPTLEDGYLFLVANARESAR
jgi:ABC-type multidrug transport system ATPase subunit